VTAIEDNYDAGETRAQVEECVTFADEANPTVDELEALQTQLFFVELVPGSEVKFYVR